MRLVVGACQRNPSKGEGGECVRQDVERRPGNPHDSVYVRGLATYLVQDLGSGVAVARCFFNAPSKGIKVFMGLGSEGGEIQTVQLQRHF